MNAIDVLIEAKRLYDEGVFYGMCACIADACVTCSGKAIIYESDLREWARVNLPDWNYEFAVENFDAHIDCDGYWWNPRDSYQRDNYFNYMISKAKQIQRQIEKLSPDFYV